MIFILTASLTVFAFSCRWFYKPLSGSFLDALKWGNRKLGVMGWSSCWHCLKSQVPLWIGKHAHVHTWGREKNCHRERVCHFYFWCSYSFATLLLETNKTTRCVYQLYGSLANLSWHRTLRYVFICLFCHRVTAYLHNSWLGNPDPYSMEKRKRKRRKKKNKVEKEKHSRDRDKARNTLLTFQVVWHLAIAGEVARSSWSLCLGWSGQDLFQDMDDEHQHWFGGSQVPKGVIFDSNDHKAQSLTRMSFWL